MTFGDRLKEARKAKGLTQKQLAAIIGVAESTLTGYEKGTREPDVFKIKSLSNSLGVSGDYLLGTDFSSNSRSENAGISTDASIRPAELRIAKKLPQLTDEQLVYIEGSVDALISQNKKAAPKDGQDDGKGAVETSSISSRQKDA